MISLSLQAVALILQFVGTLLLAVDVWYIWKEPPMGPYGGKAQQKRREYERHKHSSRQKLLAFVGFMLVLAGLGLSVAVAT